MTNSKSVSIILPSYNAEKYISESIKSVLCQTHKDLELIIINDGSTDNTEKIIQSFSDLRITYIRQENKGVSAARNVGLAQMKGNYFCFLDADDLLPPRSIEDRLKVFQSNENIDFVDGVVIYYNKKFTKKIKTWSPDFHGQPLKDLLHLTGNCFLGNTWMINRKPGKKYQFDTRFSHCEDLMFYIELSREKGLYSFTKEPVLHYRTGHKSAMSNLKDLEVGYRNIYTEISTMKDIPQNWKKAYYKKAKSIVWKSYLGHAKPVNAFMTLLKDWNRI